MKDSSVTQNNAGRHSIQFEKGTVKVDCSLQKDEILRGWTISLDGCSVKEVVVAHLWAKIREFTLRPEGVDAVALFKTVSNCPIEMNIIPDVARIEQAKNIIGISKKELGEKYEKYLSKLTSTLNEVSLPLFAETLSFAQRYYKDSSDIGKAIFVQSRTKIEEIISGLDLTTKQRVNLLRQIRKYNERKRKESSH